MQELIIKSNNSDADERSHLIPHCNIFYTYQTNNDNGCICANSHCEKNFLMKGSKSCTSNYGILHSKKLHKRRRRSRHYPSSDIIHVRVKSQNTISSISKTPQSSSSSSQRIIYDQNSLSSHKAVKLLDNKVCSTT